MSPLTLDVENGQVKSLPALVDKFDRTFLHLVDRPAPSCFTSSENHGVLSGMGEGLREAIPILQRQTSTTHPTDFDNAPQHEGVLSFLRRGKRIRNYIWLGDGRLVTLWGKQILTVDTAEIFLGQANA